MFYLHVKFFSTKICVFLFCEQCRSRIRRPSWRNPCLSSCCTGKISFFPGQGGILLPLRSVLSHLHGWQHLRLSPWVQDLDPEPTGVVSRGGQRATLGEEPRFVNKMCKKWHFVLCFYSDWCTGVLVCEQRPCMLSWYRWRIVQQRSIVRLI